MRVGSSASDLIAGRLALARELDLAADKSRQVRLLVLTWSGLFLEAEVKRSRLRDIAPDAHARIRHAVNTRDEMPHPELKKHGDAYNKAVHDIRSAVRPEAPWELPSPVKFATLLKYWQHVQGQAAIQWVAEETARLETAWKAALEAKKALTKVEGEIFL